MRTFLQKKLWRDKIITILEEQHGSKINWRYLDDLEFDQEIRIKLREESEEVIAAKSRNELIEEIADLYEVIDTLSELHQISEEEIIAMQNQKKEERGDFKKRTFVETAEHPIGSFGEKYCLANPIKYPEV